MDTTLLQALGSRWPNDQVIATNPLESFGQLFNTPAGQNYFQDNIKIDGSDSQTIASFAAANNLAYAAYGPSGGSTNDGHVPAWLGPRTSATQPMNVHEVRGELFGYGITCYIEYVPGASQSSSSDQPLNLNKRSIVRVTLPKVFPQIVLESNKNDKSYISSIPTSIKAHQKINLEGNFASYFDLFVPSGLQNEALTVLAPNFMQILMDCSSTVDVEFYGSEMILTSRDPLYTQSVMNNVLAILEPQLKYMDRLMSSWNYQPRQSPFDQLEYSYFAGEVTKIGPLRLRPLTLLTLILLGFIFFGFLIVILKRL